MAFLYLFILANIGFINGRDSDCFSYDSVVHHNRYMPRHVYRRVDVTSVFDCAALCVSSAVCKSFSFVMKKRSCHLNSANSTDGNTEYRRGVFFSDIHDWPEEVSGPCMHRKCPRNTACTVDRLLRPECITEFPGCGTPPVFQFGSPIYNGHYQGAFAEYECPVSYISCNMSCLATEKWEDVKHGCVRNKWENKSSTKASPFTSKVVFCRDTKTFTLAMTGTTKSEAPLSVNLMKGADRLLHVSINHGYNYHEHLNVIDASIDGRWMGSQRSTLVPVYKDKQFTLHIDFAHGIYKVKIDGREICSYKEKKRGVMFEKFKVVTAGDVGVKIHSLETEQGSSSW